MRHLGRPRTIFGLLWRLLFLGRFVGRALGCLLTFFIVALILLILFFRSCAFQGPVRVGSFNIENFPKSAEQIRGAFDAIHELQSDVVAVQEIMEPQTFLRAAHQNLGTSWAFVHTTTGLHRLGLLYNSDVWEISHLREHDETTLGGRHKPTLEARLIPADSSEGNRGLRVFVVHLKAGGGDHETRRAQLDGLATILSRSSFGMDRVVVVGDFNSTGEEDRRAIDMLASRTGFTWASEPVECTSYWNRRDGCLGSALDHMLTRGPVLSISAEGPCATEGCEARDQCPIFHREVSDHCPIMADIL